MFLLFICFLPACSNANSPGLSFLLSLSQVCGIPLALLLLPDEDVSIWMKSRGFKGKWWLVRREPEHEEDEEAKTTEHLLFKEEKPGRFLPGFCSRLDPSWRFLHWSHCYLEPWDTSFPETTCVLRYQSMFCTKGDLTSVGAAPAATWDSGKINLQ